MSTKQQSIIKVRKADERGHANHGWLNSFHTFSFADYHDPQHMGFRSLRVINDDTVQSGKGFGEHAHRDMEIISYVIEGALEHKDSMGNGSVIKEGNVQRISAGSGITHSEFNHSDKDLVHFLQIWIEPDKTGLKPSYEEISVEHIEDQSSLKIIGSADGQKGGMTIHQDVNVYFGRMKKGETVPYKTSQERGIWIQVIEGNIRVCDSDLAKGDGISIENSDQIEIDAQSQAEFLLLDLG